MKKIMIWVSCLALAMMLFSCKKDKEAQTTPAVTYPNYSQFKAGSYWIYQRFVIDTSGNATPKSIYDSCYVIKDTVINNRTYVKMYRPDPFGTIFPAGVSLVRDSLHYIVDPAGHILFSSQDFQTVFDSHFIIAEPNDTISREITKMEDKDVQVITPAGTFISSDYRKTYNMYPNWAFAGNPRYIHQRYSRNIGVVVETIPFFVGQPTYTERRLLRYHIVE